MGIKNAFMFVAAVITLFIGVMVLGCSQQPSAAGPPPTPEPEVGVVIVQPQRVSITAELAGRTSPYLIAEVRPQVGGIIQKRVFQEGTNIKAGDLLYQIDPASHQAAFDSAKAALSKSQANLVPAQLRAERYRDLVKDGAISKQDYDDAVAAFKQAEANVAADKAALEAAKINLAIHVSLII